MRISIPHDVLIQDVGGEMVLLNLDNEQYFGLDDVGSAMWKALTDTGSVETAFEALNETYEVAPEQLRRDLDELVEQLVNHGLLAVDTA